MQLSSGDKAEAGLDADSRALVATLLPERERSFFLFPSAPRRRCLAGFAELTSALCSKSLPRAKDQAGMGGCKPAAVEARPNDTWALSLVKHHKNCV